MLHAQRRELGAHELAGPLIEQPAQRLLDYLTHEPGKTELQAFLVQSYDGCEGGPSSAFLDNQVIPSRTAPSYLA